jgi:four helix bundle protein
MVDSSKKIQSFTDLRVWHSGHQLVLEVYKLTKKFPKDEQFGLGSQMRRCAVSVTSNIAEGFGRNGHKEKDQFYAISSGSICELQSQLFIARDISLISKEEFENIFELTITTHKMLNTLKKVNRQKGDDAKIQNLASKI